MPLPHFFLIGAPKAGTTALHAALATHPQLSMSRVKEPKFFLGDGTGPPPRPTGPGDAHSVQEHVWRRADYEALWRHEPHRLRGESTPFYLSDPAALNRMAASVPDALPYEPIETHPALAQMAEMQKLLWAALPCFAFFFA